MSDICDYTEDSKAIKRVPAAPFMDRLGAIIHAYYPDEKLAIRYKRKNKSYIIVSDNMTYMIFKVSDDGSLDVEFGDSDYDSAKEGRRAGYERFYETFRHIDTLYHSDTDFSNLVHQFHNVYGEDGNAPSFLRQFLTVIFYIAAVIALYWLSYIL